MSKKWERGFEVAKAASQLAISLNPEIQQKTRVKMGAALFSGPRLVSLGANCYAKSHPELANFGRTERYFQNIHAEHQALMRRKHYEDKNNLIMYVWRETADGKAACSKPCEMCQALMKKAGIRRVRYYKDDGSWDELKL